MVSEKVREKDLRRIVDHLNTEGIQCVAYRERKQFVRNMPP